MYARGVGLPAARARRVIVRKRSISSAGSVPVAHEFLKVLQPDIDARLIGDVQIRPRVRRVGVAEQRLLCGGGLYRRSLRRVDRRILNELAVVPEGDPGPLGEIPQIAARRLRDVVVGNHVAVGSLVVVACARDPSSSTAPFSRDSRWRRPPSTSYGRRD